MTPDGVAVVVTLIAAAVVVVVMLIWLAQVIVSVNG